MNLSEVEDRLPFEMSGELPSRLGGFFLEFSGGRCERLLREDLQTFTRFLLKPFRSPAEDSAAVWRNAQSRIQVLRSICAGPRRARPQNQAYRRRCGFA